MLKSVFVLLLFSLVGQASVECKATRYVHNEINVRQKPLQIVSEDQARISYELDIENMHFSVWVSKEVEDQLTFILSKGPDYADGILSKGAFDKNGYFKLTKVGPSEYNWLECWKR